MIYTTNYIGVLVAAAGSFFVGFMWFGPLFGKKWMSLMNFTQAHIEEGKRKGMAKPMILTGIFALLGAYVFFTVAESLGLSGLPDALCLALAAWVGFSLPIFMNTLLWEGRSLELFWLNALHNLATLVLSAIIYTYII